MGVTATAVAPEAFPKPIDTSGEGQARWGPETLATTSAN